MQKMTLRDERTWSLYCGQVRTDLDRFGQVKTGVNPTFSGRTLTSRTLLKSSQSRKLKYAVAAGLAER